MKKPFRVIGMMSGTSLDGLDIACCSFSSFGDKWMYKIESAVTLPYTMEWKTRLAGVENGTAVDLALTDSEFGHYLGEQAKKFIRTHHLRPDFIASHGHTIFHQPHRRMTFQIGSGAAIAAQTGLPVVCDFRTLDVALGGQGAPLVPIGDRHLFGDHTYCLNLGGFANISYESNRRRVAFDVCPANIVLNRLAGQAGMEFDRDGLLAASGSLDHGLLKRLDLLPYYAQKPPKSLGKEWVLSEVLPILDTSSIPLKDQLDTFCHHIAGQVAAACDRKRKGTLFVTGGGAFNPFLMKLIREKTNHEVIIPDDRTVAFKEALVFAFLGVLRIQGQPNTLRSVTGAARDTIGGAVYSGTPRPHEL